MSSASLRPGRVPAGKFRVATAALTADRRRGTTRTGTAASDWGWLASLALLWGAGTFFNELAVRGMSPLTVVFLRVALAAIFVGLVIRVRGISLLPDRKEVIPFAVLGVVNTMLPFILIAWGVQRLDSGLAGILLATTPMFTVLIAHVATSDERLGVATLTGIGLGLAGVLIMIGGAPGAILAGDGVAVLALLGAALAYGIACVYARSLRTIPPLKLAWGQLAAATVLTLPLLALPGATPTISPSWPALGAVAALALLSTAARSFLYFHVLARTGATNASLVGFLIPVSSLALGVVVLGEPLLGSHLIGLGSIVAGLMVVDGRFRPAPPPRGGSKPKEATASPHGALATARAGAAARQPLPRRGHGGGP